MTILIFRLRAALAAFGGVTLSEVRPSQAYPTRSALLGLLGAAAGIDRADSRRLDAYRRDHGFCVLVERDGVES